MANPELQVAVEHRREKVSGYIGSWNTQQAIAQNQPGGLANSPPTNPEHLPSRVTAELKEILTKNGTEQCLLRHPTDSKKWTVMTPRKIKIWVDEIIAARKEGRNNITVDIPPPLPCFKTFIGGRLPPGYREFPNDPPPAGFMAAAPAPIVQNEVTLIAPAQVIDDRIYQRKYSGTFEEFLDYADFPESDTSLRANLNTGHYTRWSDLKPGPDMNIAELKLIGIPPGNASHLLSSAVRYKKFLMEKLAALDAQQL
ncbi:uncharacterized protein MELLADRAFT_75152 [Melampsora larici-populina 98AG31]|uniref:Uncharacterized protein n=1 Tax=Melampsora larici-populina (strain 98AG31 / pathotype 3-4-7) TaxID=747676 RepID=F4RSK0_MELLP|nr:uncharacterized protein MELLADRAFT_75152 [Melampsora larici-populina 98AG31]EGG04615.1 hypothetical protein MELLADRAFT_75152 [Melampsora larici-populina 98AG31]